MSEAIRVVRNASTYPVVEPAMADEKDEKTLDDATDTDTEAAEQRAGTVPADDADLEDDADTRPAQDDDDAPEPKAEETEPEPQAKAETPSKPSVLDRMARLMGLDDPTKMPETPAAREQAPAKANAGGEVQLTEAQKETLKDLAEAMGDENDPVVIKNRDRMLAENRESAPIVSQHRHQQQEAAKQVYGEVAKFFEAKKGEGYADKYDVLDLAESVRTGKAHPMVKIAADIKNSLEAAGDSCTLGEALEAAHSIYTRNSAKGKSDAVKIDKASKNQNGVGMPPTRRAGTGKAGDPWSGVKRNLAALGVK